MRNFYATLCLTLLLGSCSEIAENGTRPDTDKIQVVLPIAESFDQAAPYASEEMPVTRTLILGDEGLDKVGWAETDKVAIWAAPGGGTDFALTAETFSYYMPLQGNALFTATIHEMTEPAYTYYGAYPVPNSINGTQVTYNLPAQQSGSYDGKLDIMLARPAEGSALTENTSPRAAQLAFAHQCHVMRIQVPTGRNLWGDEIHKLRIEFPADVVGDLAFDITDPTAAPTFTNGSRTVTLALERPLDESTEDSPDGNYVWLFLRPGATIDGVVKFHAYDIDDNRSCTLTTTIRKTLAPGRITPMTITIPQQQIVTLELNTVANRLGEAVNHILLTAPSGLAFTDGSASKTFTPVDGRYTIQMFYRDLLPNAAIGIQFDSENALLAGRPLVMPAQFDEKGTLQRDLTIPGLLDEDFGNVATFHFDDQNGTGVTGGGDNTAQDLTSLAGWTGARCGSEAGKALRICCRAENAVTVPGTYNGRADSAPMSGLKDGKTVKLRIQFKYALNRQSSKNSANQHYLVVGSHTTPGKIDAQSGVGWPFGTPMLGYKIPESAVIAKGLTTPNDGSFDNIYQSADYTVSNCTNANRFVWEVYITKKAPDGYYNNWVYLDNIVVSIAQ